MKCCDRSNRNSNNNVTKCSSCSNNDINRSVVAATYIGYVSNNIKESCSSYFSSNNEICNCN